MPPIKCNLGFNNRTFLEQQEWQTYLRRKPVRYIRKTKSKVCNVCQKAETEENPFQNAHAIGFDLGIVQLALTPEFLDDDKNIVTTHRKTCNRQAEFDLEKAMQFLIYLGIKDLPDFLPSDTHNMWIKLKNSPT